MAILSIEIRDIDQETMKMIGIALEATSSLFDITDFRARPEAKRSKKTRGNDPVIPVVAKLWTMGLCALFVVRFTPVINMASSGRKL
jgi:hypothetical protein